MARSRDAMRWWYTVEETGYDTRTGAYARSFERRRTDRDNPGKGMTVWDWSVGTDHFHPYRYGTGTAQNQKAARAAVRKIVRALPDKESK